MSDTVLFHNLGIYVPVDEVRVAHHELLDSNEEYLQIHQEYATLLAQAEVLKNMLDQALLKKLNIL